MHKSMSPAEKKKSQKKPGSTRGAKSEEDKKKIISVTMSQSLVKAIDGLVNERMGRSRAQLIEDAVKWFIDFTVHKWNERGLYVNSCRMAMESDSTLSLFFSKQTPTEQYELGRTAGSQAPVADIVRLFHKKEPTDPSTRVLVLKLLQRYGWGAIELKDNLIVIGSPFYPAQFIRGFLESLLKVRTDLVETRAKDNVALRIL